MDWTRGHGARPYASVDISRNFSQDTYSSKRSSVHVGSSANALTSPTLPPFGSHPTNEFLDIQESMSGVPQGGPNMRLLRSNRL